MKRILIVFIMGFVVFLASLGVYSLEEGAQSEIVLEKELRSEHFIIYYDKDVDQRYVYKIKNMCEKFYRKITQEFRFIRKNPWLWKNRAKVHIAKDKDDYIDKFGCPSWSSACVYYAEKAICTFPYQERFIPIFVHELTHLIFREYIGGEEKYPLWLDEGVAIYMENKYGGTHYQARLSFLKKTIKNDEYIPFSKLNKLTPQTLKEESDDYVTLFYLQSFSTVYFLIKKYGRHRFSNFLYFFRNGYAFEEALLRAYYTIPSMEELEKKWKKFYRE